MALANVAWVLATNRKRVLVLDWDLEAPGLHRYFRPFLIDQQLQSSDGLIDFVLNFADAAIAPPPTDKPLEPDWYFPHADITRYALSVNFSGFPPGGSIDFIPAGRQGATYATRVNSFNWQNFYERLGGGAFIEKAKSFMRENYDYILVDSRTGVSDTSGICTVQMPDALAVCFTYNNQSIEGAAAIARSSREGRRAIASQLGTSSFPVFPIPTRVEQAEHLKLRSRQRYARTHFEDLVDTSIDREAYWKAVEIPYVPYYGYEETLAPFSDNPGDPKSLLGAIVRVTQYLIAAHSPSETISFTFPVSEEEKRKIRQEFAATGIDDVEEEVVKATAQSAAEEKIMQAEAAFLKLDTSAQAQGLRDLTRLVRVAHTEDGGEHSRQRVRVKDLGDSRQLLSALASLLNVFPDSTTGEEMVEFVDEAYVRNWPRLRDCVQQNLDFLLWRQKFRDQIREWEANDRKSGFLLRSEQLRTAENWRDKQLEWLNDTEIKFISRSSGIAGVDSKSSGRRAFIIRPYGNKDEIDFDLVESALIEPALRELGLEGGTTIDIVEAGNIRLDMFQRLLAADVIIADLSVHDAKVFYELGIRHALRERNTFVIRCKTNTPPFDLQTDRYLIYDNHRPGASLSTLVQALRQILDQESVDSPVFRSLPDLQEPDISALATVPPDFREEVTEAFSHKQKGDLSLFSNEVAGFEWDVKGLRTVGRAQFNLKDFKGARNTWEALRRIEPNDLDANLLLGTIYERLNDLTQSTLAVERALSNKDIPQNDRAEALSLLARNAKTRWRQTWSNSPLEQKRVQALRSAYLQESIDAYVRAFDEDLNHFYSGLNALALLSIKNELAKDLLDVWLESFDTDLEARLSLESLAKQIASLSASVEQSLNSTRMRLKREHTKDVWAELSAADLLLLTSSRNARIAAAYRDALVDASAFVKDSARRQLSLYRDLGIFNDRLPAVFEVVGESPTDAQPTTTEERRVLVFAGHKIDPPHLSTPRFPADREQIARARIREAVIAEMQTGAGISYGYAGGASGGDVLFHEVCQELGIPTRLYLAFPPEKYVSTSVEYAGRDWVSRFWTLCRQREVEGNIRVLSTKTDEAEALPAWLRAKPGYEIWRRSRLWIYFNAFAEASDGKLTFITLWDGMNVDGPGSMSDIKAKTERQGGKTINIHTSSLLSEAAS